MATAQRCPRLSWAIAAVVARALRGGQSAPAWREGHGREGSHGVSERTLPLSPVPTQENSSPRNQTAFADHCPGCGHAPESTRGVWLGPRGRGAGIPFRRNSKNDFGDADGKIDTQVSLASERKKKRELTPASLLVGPWRDINNSPELSAWETSRASGRTRTAQLALGQFSSQRLTATESRGCLPSRQQDTALGTTRNTLATEPVGYETTSRLGSPSRPERPSHSTSRVVARQYLSLGSRGHIDAGCRGASWGELRR